MFRDQGTEQGACKGVFTDVFREQDTEQGACKGVFAEGMNCVFAMVTEQER